MRPSALCHLAEFVAEDRLAIDADSRNIVRSGVIDIIGCIFAGGRTDIAKKARSAVERMGSSGPSVVLGTSMNVARPQAAFLNAVAGHALDFDDWEIPGNTHPSVVIIPALLALLSPNMRGVDLAKAYLAGFEVIARLGEGLNFKHYDAGWHSTATLGALGAAAACSRLLGLNAVQTTNALSFSVSTASGYSCQFGSDAKPIQAGYAARAGVESACLAVANLTAQSHVLDHPKGMAALMGDCEFEQLQNALSKLGTGYALAEYGLVLKPWPSCGYTHRIMTCALSLRDQISLDGVERIDLHLPDFHAAVLPFRVPTNRAEALFSLPFVAAMGLVKGSLELSDLEREIWTQSRIVNLMQKVKVHPFSPKRPELNYSQEDPDRFIIALADGSQIEEECVYPFGTPQNPLSDDAIRLKFKNNAGACPQTWVDAVFAWDQQANLLALFDKKGT